MGKGDCDLIVTSDLAHHEITAIVESGYNLVILTHYSAEQYGFKKFYEMVNKRLSGKVKTHYFADTRFM
jgi:putative NIF3 family GTP cyclohydrolase 1 type 2